MDAESFSKQAEGGRDDASASDDPDLWFRLAGWFITAEGRALEQCLRQRQPASHLTVRLVPSASLQRLSHR